MKKRILVIIPAFNEEKNIESVIKKLKAQKYQVTVVDDGSIDATVQVAKKAGAMVLSHPFNLGCGAALQTGYKYALLGDFDYVVQMDGDGQHDPEFVKDLLEPVVSHKADIAIGSRFLGYSYKTEPIRRLGMIIFSFLASKIIGQRLTDATSGFRALNKKVVKFYSGEIYPTDFPDADLILATHLAGFRIVEIPVKMHPSPPTKKPMHAGLVPLYYIFKMFLSMFITILRGGK